MWLIRQLHFIVDNTSGRDDLTGSDAIFDSFLVPLKENPGTKRKQPMALFLPSQSFSTKQKIQDNGGMPNFFFIYRDYKEEVP